MKLNENFCNVLFYLNKHEKLLRDVSCGNTDGLFIPAEIYGVKLSKSLMRRLRANGYIKSGYTEVLGVPHIQYFITDMGRLCIDEVISDEQI